MLFILFVIVTLLEIYVLVSVGSAIGGLATVLLVIITALVGSILLKHQGFSILAKVREKTMLGQTPAFEMMEGVMVLVSGILLLTPGFITDVVGLLGLLPWSRTYFIDYILTQKSQAIFARNKVVFIHKAPTHKPKKPGKDEPGNTIEGEFWEG